MAADEGRPPTYLLTLSCADRPGLVFAVSSWLMQVEGNIVDSQQFDDRLGHQFFMRVHFEAAEVTLEQLRESFAPVADELGMTWHLFSAVAPYRTLVLVSRFGHCLNDLLFRQSTGALNIVVPAVVSNHRDFERLADSYDVPFHHVPVTPDTRDEAEARLLELVDELEIDLVVLARYMQVLSDTTCQRLRGQVINIHHSFLPSFKGAKPYHQAHDRGVKLIGATAHYVTPDLDEGPIIEQGVTRVNHRMTPDEMVQAGRDVEAQVLATAVQWHTEQRLLLDGSRVVVFPR
ncbi:formyltetrahydrofolate deformylase [Aeromicrobium chenweiae]|uniref:Formyltetrahydrofolate deformylase n=1 Tax=Aeromicrobium chenweiae TaxID=2079793 RepID=A0A2S0WJG1_9ACTN|nr:formyltetrahydrofolate deformylase [Aeromicrobium chenweiae]AWB91476.1 formyltetrahydrofolate deformylase [Aeromicrobium chenweiae]TGN29960.1 formyltetrahydrofolate deformylase [Aeromicrobium chenweiae]